jgi:hypothetical protein
MVCRTSRLLLHVACWHSVVTVVPEQGLLCVYMCIYANVLCGFVNLSDSEPGYVLKWKHLMCSRMNPRRESVPQIFMAVGEQKWPAQLWGQGISIRQWSIQVVNNILFPILITSSINIPTSRPRPSAQPSSIFAIADVLPLSGFRDESKPSQRRIRIEWLSFSVLNIKL